MMTGITAIWCFTGAVNNDAEPQVYAGVKDNLRILLNSLISSEILIPRKINDWVLEYETVDQLIELIADSGLLNKPSSFDITGDTVLFSPAGREVHHDIVKINDFKTFEAFFVV